MLRRLVLMVLAFGSSAGGCGSDAEDLDATSTDGGSAGFAGDAGPVGGGGSGALGGSGGFSGLGGSSGSGGSGNGATAGAGGSAGELDAGDASVSVDAAVDAPPDVVFDAGCTLPPDTSPYPAIIATAMCQLHESCCTAAGLSYPYSQCFTDAEKLMKSFAHAGQCAGGTWDANKVADCVTATQAYGCSGYDKLAMAVWHAACDEILTGPANPGAACGGNPDCFAGPNGVATCTSGKCAVGSVVGVGQSCQASLDPSKANQQCDEAHDIHCVNGTCVAPSALGTSCSASQPCAHGLSCVSNLCVEDLGAGEDCGTTTASCELGSGCFGGKCAGLVGDTCTTFLDCAQNNCLNGKCAPTQPWVLSLVTSASCN